MSQVLGAFGLLDFTTLRPVLAWGRFENYEPFIYLIFKYFSCRVKPCINKSVLTESVDMEAHLYSTKQVLSMRNLWFLVSFVWHNSPHGPGPPHSRGFLITHNDPPHLVELLWTSEQPIAETSTRQHATLTTERHPCLRLYSNPQSQGASGHSPKH
jgi:hypothetical protein